MLIPEHSSHYPDIFQDYIVRSAGYMLGTVQDAQNPISSGDRDQALHVLSFALGLTDAWPFARDLLLTMASEMEQAGYRDEWIPFLEKGIYRSQVLGDCRAEAELRFHLGILYQLLGKYDLACAQFVASASRWESTDDVRNLAKALNRHAYVARLQRRLGKAIGLVEKAQKLLQADDSERAYSLFVQGTIAFDQRKWQSASRSYQASLEIWKQHGDGRMTAWSLTNLGTTYRALERYDEAIASYEKAIELFELVGDPVHQAAARMNLGNVYMSAKQLARALEFYLMAEPVFRKTQDKLRLATVFGNKAMVYRQLRQWDDAERAYRSGLEYACEIGNVRLMVNAMDGLGQTLLSTGRYQAAMKIFADAIEQLDGDESIENLENLRHSVTTHMNQVRAALRVDGDPHEEDPHSEMT
ncbi:MAG: tetratricopeptide repeat protein [Chloroflexota bacterium]|nr:tetratricopeptide repeat protein [Chloroflexota bacterium]